MPERLLAPEGAPASLSEFRGQGASLVAEDFGTGPRAAVLLHGIGMGRSVYVDFAAQLGGRIVGIDLSGFGEAPEPAQPLSMPAHAELVAAFLQQARLRGSLVIGHSMGSQIAVELAARHPELVGGLVLAGPTVDSAARSIRQQAAYLLRDLIGERPAVLWRGAREYLRGGPHLIAKMRATIEHRPEDAFASLRCPTLVLRGEHDRMAGTSWCERIVSEIAGAQLRVIPGHGHGTLISDPGPAARAVTEFTARL